MGLSQEPIPEAAVELCLPWSTGWGGRPEMSETGAVSEEEEGK